MRTRAPCAFIQGALLLCYLGVSGRGKRCGGLEVADWGVTGTKTAHPPRLAPKNAYARTRADEDGALQPAALLPPFPRDQGRPAATHGSSYGRPWELLMAEGLHQPAGGEWWREDSYERHDPRSVGKLMSRGVGGVKELGRWGKVVAQEGERSEDGKGPGTPMAVDVPFVGDVLGDEKTGIRGAAETLAVALSISVTKAGVLLKASPRLMSLPVSPAARRICRLTGLPPHVVGQVVCTCPHVLSAALPLPSRCPPGVAGVAGFASVGNGAGDLTGHAGVHGLGGFEGGDLEGALEVEGQRSEGDVAGERVGDVGGEGGVRENGGMRASNMEQVLQFLRELGIGQAGIGRIFRQRPQLMCLRVETCLRPKLRFLIEEAGISQAKLAAVITRFPQLITLSIDKTLAPTLRYLNSLGFTSSEVGTLLASFPYILAYSVQNKLGPAVTFLVHELGVPRDSLAKLLLRKPQLLGYSIVNKLRPTVAFFTHELGLSLRTVAVMVVRC
jgi:hypothetical protein